MFYCLSIPCSVSSRQNNSVFTKEKKRVFRYFSISKDCRNCLTIHKGVNYSEHWLECPIIRDLYEETFTYRCTHSTSLSYSSTLFKKATFSSRYWCWISMKTNSLLACSPWRSSGRVVSLAAVFWMSRNSPRYGIDYRIYSNKRPTSN